MKLITNKDNIYLIVPSYNDKSSINTFMEKDFTIFVRARVIPDGLPFNDDAFILARNGKHSGISIRKDNGENLVASFYYWFSDRDNKTVYKNVSYMLSEDMKHGFNEYIMTCDHNKRQIFCYINKSCVGTIDYEGLIKEDYTGAFVWFGCGSMIVEKMYQSIGSFEYDIVFLLNKNIDLDTIYDLNQNYNEYVDLLFEELPVLNTKAPHRENILFFSDFKHKTKYKIWNYTFNGAYPQFYIENNIYF